jgi:hypothetical protein
MEKECSVGAGNLKTSVGKGDFFPLDLDSEFALLTKTGLPGVQFKEVCLVYLLIDSHYFVCL